MPVRFKGSSEYKTHYNWHDSRKSASFCPSPEQSAKEAGLKSAELSFTSCGVREPPLQRKRYPINPTAKITSTTKMYIEDPSEDSTDIAVTNKKIQRPIKPDSYKLSKHKPDKEEYRLRDEPRKDLAKTYKLDKKADKAKTYKLDSRPDKSKTYKLDPKVDKDIASHKPRKADVVIEKPKVLDHRNEKENIAVNHDVPSESDRGLKYRAGHRRKHQGPKRMSEYQRQFEWKNPSSKESPLIAAEQMVYNSNAIQTYMPKNIPSKTEYDAQFQAWNQDRPTQIEMVKEHARKDAEIEAKQKKKVSRGKRKKSGSKKEVMTPDQMPAAGVPTFHLPDQLKHAQNPHKPFFPHAAMKKWKSEYRSNYHDPRVFSYMDGVWRGADPPQIQPRDDTSDMAPAESTPNTNDKQTATSHDSKWFKEVVELRKKAQEYQKRARGTHFSREHLAQLLAQQARLWEQESEASTSTLTPSEHTVSTVRYAAGKTYSKEVASQQQAQLARAEHRAKQTPPSDTGDSSEIARPSSAKRKLAWPVERQRQEEESSIGSIPTPSSSRDTLMDCDDEGRIPTPRLTQVPVNVKQRHHLARTTPAVGGALLSSPSTKRSSGVKKHTPRGVTESDRMPSRSKYQHSPQPTMQHRRFDKPVSDNGYRSDDEESDIQLSRQMIKKSSHDDKVPCSCGADVRSHTKVIKSPSAGINTRDPDPIDNYYPTSPFQRHSQRQYETGPVEVVEEESPPRSSDIRPHKTWAGHLLDEPRQSTMQKNSPPHVRKPAEAWSIPLDSRAESGFITPPPRPEGRLDRRDDDMWSVKSTGTISTQSSCSLASQVLERARKRRDEFWGEQTSTPTK